jgi:outer membrane protein
VKTTGIGIPGETKFDSSLYELSLRQPLLRVDLFALASKARAELSGAEAGYGAALQALIVDVAERYFGVLSANENLIYARADSAATLQRLKQIKARESLGAATIADLREVEAGYDLTVAQEIAADARLASALQALRERAGEVGPIRALKPKLVLSAPEGRVEDWTGLAAAQNLNVIAAHDATRAAAREVSVQRAGHWPSLDFVARQTATESGGRFGDSEVDDRALAFELNVPIFAGGQVMFRSREAAARHIETAEIEERARRAAIRAATDAWRAVVANISRASALARSVGSTEVALKAVEVGYQAGTRTIVDVLDVQRTHYRARRDYAIERHEYVVNSLRLKQAAGTLSVTDVNALADWFAITE